MKGRCACGSVVYELLGLPYDAGWCHCRICQRVSGSPALAFATVALPDWQVVEGEDQIGKYRSSPAGERQFCKSCGTQLTMHVSHQPGEIDFTLASLDHPALVHPTFHIFCAEGIHWAPICDSLPRHNRLRPDTRGLPPGQTTL